MEMLSALCLTGKLRKRERKARREQCETEKGGKLQTALFSLPIVPHAKVLFKML